MKRKNVQSEEQPRIYWKISSSELVSMVFKSFDFRNSFLHFFFYERNVKVINC